MTDVSHLKVPLVSAVQNNLCLPHHQGQVWIKETRPQDKSLLARCPVILCKAIDHLHRERNVIGRELGEESREGVKKVVEELSKLRLVHASSCPQQY